MTAYHFSSLRAACGALAVVAVLSIATWGAAVAQAVEKPAGKPTSKDAGPSEGFAAAKVKADAPDGVKQFFADSDQVRLEIIESQLAAIDRANSKLYGLNKKRLNQGEMAQQAVELKSDIARRSAVITKLLTDVEFIPAYENMTGAKEGSKFLKLDMVLRFSRPVRVVRVVGADRALITVEQQVLVKRKNKSGQMITVIDSKPVKALAKVDTAGMTDGALFELRQPFRVTDTAPLEEATVFVLEPFSAAEYLERSPDRE